MRRNACAWGNLREISIGGRVYSAREFEDCLVTLIEVVDRSSASDYNVCWTRIGVVAVEIQAELLSICTIFEIEWVRTVNNFLRSGNRVL
jgi:hypothetical protein